MEVITVHIENTKSYEGATYIYNDDNIMRFLYFLDVSLAGFQLLSQKANTKLYDKYKYSDGWIIKSIERTLKNE